MPVPREWWEQIGAAAARIARNEYEPPMPRRFRRPPPAANAAEPPQYEPYDEAAVRGIRARAALTSCQDEARRYGISKGMVTKIRAGRAYKDLLSEEQS
jgi:hypothetical protein